ncbi:MAG: Crp/Fnr family transcriptional regulator [Dehalobacter sp.]|nr:Crp/Fnr family transcriptional regulator [Dehalobacter sp.]
MFMFYSAFTGQPISDRFANYVKCNGIEAEFKKGTTILNEGDIVQHMFYVNEGWVAYCLDNPNGDSRIASLVGPGRSFGTGSAFDQLPIPVNLRVIQKCKIYMLTRKDLIQAMKEDITLGIEVISNVNARCRTLLGSVNFFSNLATPEERIIYYFLSLLHFSKYKEAMDWYELPINLSHTQIGQIIGTSRVTVCQIFNNYKAEGKIKFSKQKLFISHELISHKYCKSLLDNSTFSPHI